MAVTPERRAYMKQYYAKNKETIQARARERYATDPEYREKRQTSWNKYHQDHKAHYNELARNRRGSWSDDQMEAHKQYCRQYYSDHRDEILEQQRQKYHADSEKSRETCRRYYLEHQAEILERKRRKYREDPSKVREASKRYRETHQEKVKDYQKQYREKYRDDINKQQRDQYWANAEERRERARQYYHDHRDEIRAKRAAKREAEMRALFAKYGF